MIVRLLLVLLMILGLLVGTHYFIHYSVVRAFIIEQGAVRKALFSVLLFFSLSFPASVLLVRIWRNFLSECFFILSMVWMGLFLNLLLAATAGWLLVGAARLAGRELDPKWVAIVAGSLAVLFTAHGAWRARRPQVHRIDVAIEGLPEGWRDRTIVHLSDLHLGHIHGRWFIERVAREVNALAPEMVLITGDLFDGLGGDYPSFVDAVDTIEAVRGVFFVFGNHEVYSQTAPVLDRLKLRVLHDEVVEVDGLQIVGVGYPGLSSEEELARLRKEISGEKPSILLFHTPTDVMRRGEDMAARHSVGRRRSRTQAARQFATYWAPDTSCTLNRELGIDLQLSGHAHAGQVFPFGLLTRLIYKGRDRGLHRDGSYHLYVSDGTGTFGPPMRTAGRSEIVAITLRAGTFAKATVPNCPP